MFLLIKIRRSSVLEAYKNFSKLVYKHKFVSFTLMMGVAFILSGIFPGEKVPTASERVQEAREKQRLSELRNS